MVSRVSIEAVNIYRLVTVVLSMKDLILSFLYPDRLFERTRAIAGRLGYCCLNLFVTIHNSRPTVV